MPDAAWFLGSRFSYPKIHKRSTWCWLPMCKIPLHFILEHAYLLPTLSLVLPYGYIIIKMKKNSKGGYRNLVLVEAWSSTGKPGMKRIARARNFRVIKVSTMTASIPFNIT